MVGRRIGQQPALNCQAQTIVVLGEVPHDKKTMSLHGDISNEVSQEVLENALSGGIG
jgi:hypothetical protein